MTTPSGTIYISQVDGEIGLPNSSPYSNLSFLNGYVIPGQRDSYPDMNEMRNRAYYQSNNKGNCNNGNCGNCNCNCGNICCYNCYINGHINCTNCDGQNWLQNNCNCNCTYNCNYASGSYNCNCNCNCNC